MALASINIPAMKSLITTIRTADTEFNGRKTSLRGNLSGVGLPTGSELPIGTTAQWCTDQVPGLVRRLALAEAAEAQKAGLQNTVQIDESAISNLSPADAQKKAAEIAAALKSGQQLTDEQWKTLIDNANDPYFSVALANAVTPTDLARVAQGLSSAHQYDLQGIYPQPGETYEQARNRVVDAYKARLTSLGVMLGTASRSQDPKLAPGYAQDVVTLLTQNDGRSGGNDGLPVAMSVILSSGTYSKDFAATVAQGVYDFERSENFTTWSAVAGQYGAFILPGGQHRTDVMPGVMRMLSSNAEASQDFFAGGPTTTIKVGDTTVTVTERMKYLVTDRTWAGSRGSDEGDALGAALQSATTTFRNRDATGMTSSKVATQLFALIGGKTGEGKDGGILGIGADNGWEMHREMRDDVAAILADYAPDLFRTTGDHGTSDADFSKGYADSNAAFPPSMPYGALMTKDMIAKIMFTLGQDPAHVKTVTSGWAVANQINVAYQIDRNIGKDPDFLAKYAQGTARDPLHNYVQQGASVLDFLVDSAYVGDDADAKVAEQRAKATKDALSLLLAIPPLKPAAVLSGAGQMVVDWGSFAYDQAKSKALDAVGSSGAGESSTKELNSVREEAAKAAEATVIQQLYAAGYWGPDNVAKAKELGVTIAPPPADAFLKDDQGRPVVDAGGRPVLDPKSQAYNQWVLDNAPVAAIHATVITAFGLEPR